MLVFGRVFSGFPPFVFFKWLGPNVSFRNAGLPGSPWSDQCRDPTLPREGGLATQQGIVFLDSQLKWDQQKSWHLWHLWFWDSWPHIGILHMFWLCKYHETLRNDRGDTHKRPWPFQPRPFADVIGVVRCSYVFITYWILMYAAYDCPCLYKTFRFFCPMHPNLPPVFGGYSPIMDVTQSQQNFITNPEVG